MLLVCVSIDNANGSGEDATDVKRSFSFLHRNNSQRSANRAAAERPLSDEADAMEPAADRAENLSSQVNLQAYR